MTATETDQFTGKERDTETGLDYFGKVGDRLPISRRAQREKAKSAPAVGGQKS